LTQGGQAISMKGRTWVTFRPRGAAQKKGGGLLHRDIRFGRAPGDRRALHSPVRSLKMTWGMKKMISNFPNGERKWGEKKKKPNWGQKKKNCDVNK